MPWWHALETCHLKIVCLEIVAQGNVYLWHAHEHAIQGKSLRKQASVGSSDCSTLIGPRIGTQAGRSSSSVTFSTFLSSEGSTPATSVSSFLTCSMGSRCVRMDEISSRVL